MSGEMDFQELYGEFRPKILRYLSQLIAPEEAEDIAQEVFEKVNRGLKGFEGRSKLSTWIYRIATNTALDKLRSPAFRHLSGIVPVEEISGAGKISIRTGQRQTSVDQEMISKEMSRCVQSFIEKLPADYKMVILLSELEDFSNKEIAEILDVSLETVKIRLHRARARLKKLLQENCTFYRNERNVLACDVKTAFDKYKESN